MVSGQLPIGEPPAIRSWFPPSIPGPTMDDAEREDILNDALELFGAEKVDDSGVIMYGPLRLSVAQKVGLWPCLCPNCTNKALQ